MEAARLHETMHLLVWRLELCQSQPVARLRSKTQGRGARGGPDRTATPSSRLLALFDGHRLTPTQRRIAQCLVEHGAEAAFLSSSEVAALASVSQPSVTRFAVALGFEGYPDLRRQLRKLGLGDRRETVDEARRNAWQQAAAAEIANLERLSETLSDPTPVEDAGRLLASARPLLVLGLRVSISMARYFGYFAAKVHPDVRVITAAGSVLDDQLQQAWDAGGRVLLAFVLPRYPREAVETLRRARELGFTVIAVTDSQLSPVSGVADLVLAVPVASRLVFDSHAAPMLLTLVLLQALCDAIPAQVQQRLEEFERSAAERQLFVP